MKKMLKMDVFRAFLSKICRFLAKNLLFLNSKSIFAESLPYGREPAEVSDAEPINQRLFLCPAIKNLT